MKHYHIIIVSKTKKSLYKFLSFLDNSYVNSKIIKKDFKNEKRKKILTILKSPHVNKTAQEQFQLNLFSTQLTIYSNNNYQFLIFLKKIKNNLFPEIKINIKFPVHQNFTNKTQTQLFNPSNFKLNTLKNSINKKFKTIYKNNNNNNFKQIKNFIKIFDVYGEFYVKKFG